ncbi:hypothetical protein ACFL3S_12975 [Gemmatimonadota bacterium]
MNRARDELFSHINRCGVLQAGEEDQRHWMDETIDYLAERYPDLSDGDLQDLYAVGMRFCQPAIPHGRSRYGYQGPSPKASAEPDSEPEPEAQELVSPDLVSQEVGGENTQQEN